ncbi:MAG TPA: hypothetical protein VGN72_14455 [Tepidisphaeraceae bacterium]|jgi:hypothetical protein|nr:hypothetical protein [Tepidisphaeraceae bacterium]
MFRNSIVFLTALSLSTLAYACPTCGKAVEVLPPPADGSGGLAGGFNASIYVLLGTVVLAMGFLAWNVMRSGKAVGGEVRSDERSR